jgi:DNA invertase Pin-like site-specific DNA recombinase
MKIGYARVSTEDQNPDLQLTALKAAGCERIFTDTATGANVKRPELTKCLKALNKRDTFAVWKLDRLGLFLHDLINLLDELKSRGVRIQLGSVAKFVSLSDNWPILVIEKSDD